MPSAVPRRKRRRFAEGWTGFRLRRGGAAYHSTVLKIRREFSGCTAPFLLIAPNFV